MKGNREDMIAQDLYDFNGALYTITKLCEFLKVGRRTGEEVVKDITPSVGKQYYFRDIAEVLANGKTGGKLH